MIEGFDQETHELTQDEKLLVPKFIKSFSSHVGRENAVTSGKIISGFARKGILITGARVRKIINYIRRHDLVIGLVANSDGYYITRDPAEMWRYVQSLEQRIAAINQIKKKSLDYFYSLQNLFSDEDPTLQKQEKSDAIPNSLDEKS